MGISVNYQIPFVNIVSRVCACILIACAMFFSTQILASADHYTDVDIADEIADLDKMLNTGEITGKEYQTSIDTLLAEHTGVIESAVDEDRFASGLMWGLIVAGALLGFPLFIVYRILIHHRGRVAFVTPVRESNSGDGQNELESGDTIDSR